MLHSSLYDSGLHAFHLSQTLQFNILPDRLALTASFQRDKTPNNTNACLQCNTKQSDGEVPVILYLCRTQSTPLLTSFLGQ